MRSVCVLAALCFFAGSALAQFPPADRSSIQLGTGVTWIDNQPFYTVHFTPELALTDFGVGLDLTFEFDAQGKLRKEDFNEFSDYASVIRYVRYGKERDPFYIRLGALDYTTIGHGSIINSYNNSPSFDSRRIGLAVNLDMEKYAVQAMYGNFGQAGVVGLRGAVKPLRFTSLADVPVVGGLEIGATYAGDFDKYATIDPASSLLPDSVRTLGSLNIIGGDIGLPIIRGDFAGLDLYADYVKILDFGSGGATGMMVTIAGIPALHVSAKIERRWNGKRYLPAYFNSFYETERYNTEEGIAKSIVLGRLDQTTQGIFGDLLVSVINTFDIYGSYQQLDGDSRSGILHLWTQLAPADAPIVARAGYDKKYIQSFQDLVTTDDRSLLYAELGYKPIPYIIVSTVYRWTYTPIRSGDTIVGYAPQRRVEPRITFVYSF